MKIKFKRDYVKTIRSFLIDGFIVKDLYISEDFQREVRRRIAAAIGDVTYFRTIIEIERMIKGKYRL